jgi:hypothetical protein
LSNKNKKLRKAFHSILNFREKIERMVAFHYLFITKGALSHAQRLALHSFDSDCDFGSGAHWDDDQEQQDANATNGTRLLSPLSNRHRHPLHYHRHRLSFFSPYFGRAKEHVKE